MKYFVKIDGLWNEYDNTMPLDATKVIDLGNKIMDITNFERVEVNSEEELSWENTALCDKQYRTGWLSPSGKFYGCLPYYHTHQARMIHDKEESELEEDGWVKITNASNEPDEKNLRAFFASDDDMVYPTNEQIEYIYRNYKDQPHLASYLMNVRRHKSEAIRESFER